MVRNALLVLYNAQLVCNNATTNINNHMEMVRFFSSDSGDPPTDTFPSAPLPLPEKHLGLATGEGFEFFHCNLNGFATNSATVVLTIRRRPTVPHIVFLNETKTDEGDPLHLHGYKLVSRRDRDGNGGGIAVFCLAEQIDHVTHIEQTEATSEYERCWICVHTDEGPILVCCWYRPPDEHTNGLNAFN